MTILQNYFYLITLLVILVNKNVESAKILGVFPYAKQSHFFLGRNLLIGLAERGHEIVMITPFPVDVPNNVSFREVNIGSVEGPVKLSLATMNSPKKKQSLLTHMTGLKNAGEKDIIRTLSHPNVKELLNSNEKFDVVIVEQFHLEGMKVLAWYFDAHLIPFSTIGANAWLNYFVGNPSPPSYIPDMAVDSATDLTFFQRMDSLQYRLTREYYNHFIILPSHDKVIRKFFPNAPPLENIVYNTSLIFLNSHESFNPAIPKVPNMIDIGGFHVKPPKKLPKDLQKLLDESKDGVIFFSMGSRLRTADLPKIHRDMFLKVFSKLKQTILWKWEDENLPGKPSNVVIQKWFQQQDILAHPNVKLFITHGGLLSKIEHVYHGVPVLAIPVFGDQHMNSEVTVSAGYGLRIAFNNLTETYFEECLMNLLNDPKYTENAKEASRIFHDRPLKPLDTASYWVDYVVRHNGASHLRVAATKLYWYQYLLLDVIAFCLATIFIFSLIIFYVIRKISAIFKKENKIKSN